MRREKTPEPFTPAVDTHQLEAQKEKQIPPEIIATLEAHIIDVAPHEVGRRELVSRMGDAAIGAKDVEITRPDPAMQIESATLERGKNRVLIGPNGAGKSTLFDGLMERGAFFETRSGRGAVRYGDPRHARERLRIARLDQEELLGKIEEHTAQEVLASAAAYFKAQFPINWDDPKFLDQSLKNQEAHVRIDTLLSQITKLFNMQEFLERKVKELSGGERTKLALFQVLLSEPDVLLLDEPTNHLDLRSIAKLMALFEAYKKAGVAIVSVSHVDWFLQDAGQDGVLEIVWNKEEGRRVRESNASYARYIKDSSREVVPIISGEVEWPQQDYGYKVGSTLIETPDRFTVPDSPLANVRLPTIHGGEVVILSGDNGTGKTKLMDTMVNSRDQRLPRRAKGVQTAYLPQFWPEDIAAGTIQDFFHWVKEKTSPHSTGSAVHKEKPAQKCFVEMAAKLNFGGSSRIGEGWLKRPFRQLSGGEQRLLWFVAVSALRDVDMLVLDEPTNHMDRNLQEKVTQAIKAFPGAVVLSTHDRNLMTELSQEGRSGAARTPTHLVLEKKNGQTQLTRSEESPITYMARVMDQARRNAKRVDI